MKKLTNKEKEIMDLYFRQGTLGVLRRASSALQYALHDGSYSGEGRLS